jgi:hypothetical protein
MRKKHFSLTKRQVNSIGISGVIIVAIVTVYLFAPGTVVGKASFNATLLQPEPLSPSTGQPETTIQLTINYTGLGKGDYIYTFRYNLHGQTETISQHIVVSQLSVFTSYLYLPAGVNMMYIAVYKGSSMNPSSTVFNKTIAI